MAKANTTMSSDIQTEARLVDFVTRFSENWEHLNEILGTLRRIEKPNGTMLTTKRAVVTLQSGDIAEGNTVPNSKATVIQENYGTLTLKKYQKDVTAEAIAEHGYDDAVTMTDDAMLFEVQSNVTDELYAFIQKGLLTAGKTGFQSALAEAQAQVMNKWKKMHRTVSGIVAWANVLDAYDYLGTANVNNVEKENGLTYLKNFLGCDVLFLCSENEIPRGKIIATPTNNIIMYYINPANSDFVKAGLKYTVDNKTHLIGAAVTATYEEVVSSLHVLYGLALMAEYRDGIAVITFNGSMDTITATSAAGTDSGTKLTITNDDIPEDWTFYFKSQASTAPSAPNYLAAPTGWTKLTVDEDGVADNVTATNAHKGTIIATNAAGQVVAASGAITIAASA